MQIIPKRQIRGCVAMHRVQYAVPPVLRRGRRQHVHHRRGVLALARLYRPMLLGQCPVLPQAILVARARHVRLVPVTQAQIRRMLVGHVLVETTQALPNVAPVVAEEAEVDVAGVGMFRLAMVSARHLQMEEHTVVCQPHRRCVPLEIQ